MSKRRKPNSRRPGTPRPARDVHSFQLPSSATPSMYDMPSYDWVGSGEQVFNQNARRQCDECGSAVEWLTGPEAEARGIDLRGGMEFLGIETIPNKDVWVCAGCDNFGIMGPLESGF